MWYVQYVCKIYSTYRSVSFTMISLCQHDNNTFLVTGKEMVYVIYVRKHSGYNSYVNFPLLQLTHKITTTTTLATTLFNRELGTSIYTLHIIRTCKVSTSV